MTPRRQLAGASRRRHRFVSGSWRWRKVAARLPDQDIEARSADLEDGAEPVLTDERTGAHSSDGGPSADPQHPITPSETPQWASESVSSPTASTCS